MKLQPNRGFTLIEMMIALAVAVLLLIMAAPSYSVWVADSQIRAAAESIVSGMRYAQAEAVKRNESVVLILDPTTGSGGWQVQDAAGTTLQVAVFAEGARLAQFVTTPATATQTTFNPFGGITNPNVDLTLPVREIAISHSAVSSGTRPLTVLVGGGRTGIKVCDPAVSDSTSPRFCTI
ncbi:MAG: GspH/FimT family pseudopilin [Betaproteobacteria bacterium]